MVEPGSSQSVRAGTLKNIVRGGMDGVVESWSDTSASGICGMNGWNSKDGEREGAKERERKREEKR